MCTAFIPALTSASCASCGNSAAWSTLAANGAIFSSARARTDSRSASCSGDRANAGDSRLMASMVKVLLPSIYNGCTERAEGRGAAWTEERGARDERRGKAVPQRRPEASGKHTEPAEGRGAAWTEERGARDERRGKAVPQRRPEASGKHTEPAEGRGAAWTEERGARDERRGK